MRVSHICTITTVHVFLTENLDERLLLFKQVHCLYRWQCDALMVRQQAGRGFGRAHLSQYGVGFDSGQQRR